MPDLQTLLADLPLAYQEALRHALPRPADDVKMLCAQVERRATTFKKIGLIGTPTCIVIAVLCMSSSVRGVQIVGSLSLTVAAVLGIVWLVSLYYRSHLKIFEPMIRNSPVLQGDVIKTYRLPRGGESMDVEVDSNGVRYGFRAEGTRFVEICEPGGTVPCLLQQSPAPLWAAVVMPNGDMALGKLRRLG